MDGRSNESDNTSNSINGNGKIVTASHPLKAISESTFETSNLGDDVGNNSINDNNNHDNKNELNNISNNTDVSGENANNTNVRNDSKYSGTGFSLSSSLLSPKMMSQIEQGIKRNEEISQEKEKERIREEFREKNKQTRNKDLKSLVEKTMTSQELTRKLSKYTYEIHFIIFMLFDFYFLFLYIDSYF